MENNELIIAKIMKLAETRKFMGVSKQDLKNKHLKKMAVAELEKGLRFLRKDGKLLYIDGLYFPPGWKPGLSPFEEEVVKSIKPCLLEGRRVESFRVVKQFKTFNEESVKRLLLKLELSGRAVKLDEGIYLDISIYNRLLALAGKLKSFSLSKFIEKSGFKRGLCFMVLSRFDEQGLTRFDGEKRVFVG